ncbi:MAG TPA: alginate export family protein, partial [Candidatus Hydrogenedentes bacterium]|nr:alginate export family protein [Candidatus Hydrogenedentota bacterium]
NYITGGDFITPTDDDVEVYQSYIEANEMFGLPLRLRVGRQEIALGSEWLVGVNDTSSFFTGLSFDAARLTYATDMFSVDLFAAELAEGGPFEEDEDVWLYGLYGSYLGLEDIVIDAYWLWVRDARRLSDTNLGWFGEWIEDVFSLDDYDPTNLHTVGLRGAGTIGAFDFEAEFAYQFGDADQVGFLFRPFFYGDDDADFQAWAGNLEVGYTFDMAWQPRVWLGAAYFDGEDNRDISFWEWLSPFDSPEASVSFNRLFSNWEYSQFLDDTTLSNSWLVRGGVEAMPTESLELRLVVSYFDSLEAFDAPAHINLFGYRIPIAGPFSFWTMENDTPLGIEAALYATYHYSEDLVFEAGWAHLFTDDGATEGQYVLLNGLGFSGGTGDEDADYLYVETRIQF